MQELAAGKQELATKQTELTDGKVQLQIQEEELNTAKSQLEEQAAKLEEQKSKTCACACRSYLLSFLVCALMRAWRNW